MHGWTRWFALTLAVTAVGCSDSSGDEDTESGGGTETSDGTDTTSAGTTGDSTTSDGTTSAGTTSAGTTMGTTTDEPTTGGGAGDWWDCGWSNRTRLVILGPAGDEVLEDFPVPVTPDAAWFDFDAAGADGADLRFIDADGNELAFEIESWAEDPGYVAWVKIPSIPAQGQGVTVDLYYGNGAAEDAQAPADTWSAYARVWHMSGAREDSVEGAGLMGQATSAPGILGNAESIGAMGDLLQENPAGIDGALFAAGATLSAWVNPVSYGGNGFGRIATVSSAFAAEGGWTWLVSDNANGHGLIRGHDTSEGFWTYNNTVPLDAWTHVALSYDDTDSTTAPVGYGNGVSVAPFEVDAAAGTPTTTATEPLTIGDVAFAGDSRQFDGVIDELRIRTEVSSARWVAAEHASGQGNMVVALEQATAPAECG